MGILKKIKNLFFKPDIDDHYIIEKWRKETDQADRIKELHRQSRKQSNIGLNAKDQENKKQKDRINKQKNKTLSSNF